MGPEQGDSMVLMGLPPLAGTLALFALLLISLPICAGGQLAPWEHIVAYSVGLVVLIPCAVLFLRG
jgi:hypothetical protein